MKRSGVAVRRARARERSAGFGGVLVTKEIVGGGGRVN